ncbi:hypothetical protein HNP84_007398 [Thermocatellispora tengchongensis]|uniref:Uncharacterized protein n=1 Tax=Thermocatellispora tengchongensis TaxID=1073253 RepID=A0A840PFT6_9ACTN|nr:hypothetical protein [Thermocatellispora tengchongensis]
MTWRPRYCPHAEQTVWGRLGFRQAGFGQVTKVGAAVFHCERRARVFARDFFLNPDAAIGFSF